MDNDSNGISKKRGRPVGHRLSEGTKEKIRVKRLGTHHSQETRSKISKSLSEFFRSQRSFSESLAEEYIYISEDAVRWVFDNDENLDENDMDVIPDKKINSLRQVEISLGMDVDQFFGHNATPEFLLLLKEKLENTKDLEILEEFMSLL